MNWRRLYPILPLILFLSCSKDYWTEERMSINTSLLDIYYSPALLKSCNDDGDSVTFEFSDGVCADVSRACISVHSATDGSFPDVRLKNGQWEINGKKSGIFFSEGIGNKLSKIVCLAYDCNALRLYMSNGNVLHIPSSPEGSLWSFAFRTEENAFLEETIECKVAGTEISASVPSSILDKDLCPSIGYRGISLSVNSKLQTDRVSSVNFSGAVEYRLVLYDKSEIIYTVNLSEPYPTVWIYTDNCAEIQKDKYTGGRIRICDPEHRYWDKDEFEASMKIKGRGNSTWIRFPKKPYRIKLDEKAQVFGVSKNKDWVLLANYSDKSLLRNTTAFRVSRICQMQWTPEIFNVDVYLNDGYIGSYDFTEQKEVASHRVEIDVEAGDCYLEIEAQKDNPVCFDTPMNIPIMFSEPEYPSEELKNEIVKYFQDFESSLTSPQSDDPDKGYRAYVDVDSFINHYIVQELSKNIDADLFKSLFLVKRKNGKLEFCHVWDFDLAFGNCNYLNAHQGVSTGPTGWYIRNHTQEGIDTGWYYYMFKDKEFVKALKRRWTEVYPALRQVPDEMREYSRAMHGSAGRNFNRWHILDTYVWPNVVWLGDYDAEVEYMLDFYSERLEWMNGQIEAM
ncbi:MAG: CotH kinase family protein [Candidatus Cryptobacteroides sp.]